MSHVAENGRRSYDFLLLRAQPTEKCFIQPLVSGSVVRNRAEPLQIRYVVII